MSRHVNFNTENFGGEASGIISKMKSAFNTTTLMYIVAAILFITICVFFYYQYIKPALKPTYASNREQLSSESSSSKEAELMLFYVDWCPHCKTAKPDWEELKTQYENKTINGYHIIFTEIKLLKDGQVIEYDAKPSKDTLDQFLNTVL